jgi:hypothetical protein
MDEIIKKLNNRMIQEVAKVGIPNVPTPGSTSKFDQVLGAAQEKRSQESLMEKMVAEIREPDASSQGVLSAKEIQVDLNTTRPEYSVSKNESLDPSKAATNVLTTLNDDMLRMDAAIEVLSDPGTKLSRRQVLAYQFGFGNISINMELYSKMTQSVTQNVNQILQMNV